MTMKPLRHSEPPHISEATLHPIHPPLHSTHCSPNSTDVLFISYPSIPFPYPLGISRRRPIELVTSFREGIWCTPHLQHPWCVGWQLLWHYPTLPRLRDDRTSFPHAWQRYLPVGVPSNSSHSRSGAWYSVQGMVRFWGLRSTSPLILPVMPLLPANTDPSNPNDNHHKHKERKAVAFLSIIRGE